MNNVKFKHSPSLTHHVEQSEAWLSLASEGENTAALSYAALEARFAIEQLAVYYWATLLGRDSVSERLKDIQSFSRMENRIYELAGHQAEIDRHFEFIRILLAKLKVEFPLHTPNVGLLRKYWQDCSALCHITWPLACSEQVVRDSALKSLSSALDEVKRCVASLGWPMLKDASFAQLRSSFVCGTATAADVVAYADRVGLWGKASLPDGRLLVFPSEPRSGLPD